MSDAAKFTVGQIVRHKRFGYRGVVYDLDSEFSGSEEWYEYMAKSRPPKDAPWYKVLVDEAAHETYVAERNLEFDDDPAPIRHPAVADMFEGLDNGAYVPRRTAH